MVNLDPKLIKFLAREVRNANGIERTPKQIEIWCMHNFVNPEEAVLRVLCHADNVLILANKMRIPYLDSAPPSSEWD